VVTKVSILWVRILGAETERHLMLVFDFVERVKKWHDIFDEFKKVHFWATCSKLSRLDSLQNVEEMGIIDWLFGEYSRGCLFTTHSVLYCCIRWPYEIILMISAGLQEMVLSWSAQTCCWYYDVVCSDVHYRCIGMCIIFMGLRCHYNTLQFLNKDFFYAFWVFSGLI